jgi:hypothetical protein
VEQTAGLDMISGIKTKFEQKTSTMPRPKTPKISFCLFGTFYQSVQPD